MENNQHNQGGLIAFMATLIFNILFFVYISFVHPGVVGLDKVGTPVSTQPK